jgi:hypothetical protein
MLITCREQTKWKDGIKISCNLKLPARRVYEELRILMGRQNLVDKKNGYDLKPALGHALFSGHKGISHWGKKVGAWT